MDASVLRFSSARRMLIAQANQGAAGWMQTTAGSWYVLSETKSASMLALFAVVSMLPSLLFNPLGGRLMDRYSPLVLVKILAPLAATIPLVIALLYATGLLSVPLILWLTVFGSSFRALQAPTFSKILPMTVPDSERANILAYSAIAFNISRSIGPLVAGFAGTGLAYFFGGLSFLLVAAIVFATQLSENNANNSQSQFSRHAAPVPYKRSLALIWEVSPIRSLFVCITLFYLVTGAIHQVLAAVAKDTSSTSASLGVLYACAAVGAMLANPATMKYLNSGCSRTVPLVTAIAGAGVTTVLFGMTSSLPWDMAFMVVIGALGEVVFLTAQRGILVDLPEFESGTVFGLFLSALTAASIVGSAGLGVLMETFGVRSALVFVGLGACGLGIFVIGYLVRHPRPGQ